MYVSPFHKFRKAYRGSYTHVSSGGQTYMEESFEAFKDEKSGNMHFDVQMLGRLSNGEILKISILYSFRQNWLPLKVEMQKNLGPLTAIEIFDTTESGVLDYSFITNAGEHNYKTPVPPKCHIITPSATLSFNYLLSKKLDTTTKNYFTLIASRNEWEFDEENPIESRSAALERISSTSESITVKNQSLEAIQYKLFDGKHLQGESSKKDEDLGKAPFLRAYISKHISLPYLIRADDGTSVEVEYLNNLSEADA